MQTYPIQTGPSAPVTTFLLASQLGLALNCDLVTGLDKTTGAAAADDGPAINAAMAGATADHPLCLVMDGSACVSGLKLPAGGHWSIQGFGRDTGFFAAQGANFHVISNISTLVSVPQGPAPSRGANGNVSIRDIAINGNAGNGTMGNSTTGDGRGNDAVSWYYNLYLKGLNGIEIRNVYFTHSPSFNLVFENCGDWVVDGCNFEGQTGNTDGVHVNGPSNNGRITNCTFQCGDDPIALNAWEGYGGLITQIAIDNCISCSQTLGRIYTTSTAPAGGGQQPSVNGVTWSNYQASAYTDNGLIIGLGQGPGNVVDTITNVTFINCKFTSSQGVEITDSVGTLTFDACDFIGVVDGCVFEAALGSQQVSALNINNCRVLRTAAGIASLIGSSSAVAFKRIAVNGLSLLDVGGYSGAAIAGLLSLASSSTLAQLHLADLDASNIAALAVSGTAAPTAVSGSGVLQTGWPIADSAMAKWTPYVSATSGAPSYRNAAGAVIAL